MTVIELVRHASAGKRNQWTGGPDRERPLDAKGLEQADGLARLLPVGAPIARIVSSGYRRCVMTVEPLARHLGLEVAADAALEEIDEIPVTAGGAAWAAAAWLGGRALDLVDRCLADAGDTRTVLCSHGDVIPALVATLAGRDGLAVRDVTCRKGGRFTLLFDGGRCVSAQRHDAPATSAAGRAPG